MMRSTTRNKLLSSAGILAFWLLVWQIGSIAVGQEILLASPLSVLRSLIRLAATGEFWFSIFSSFLKIFAGFGLALLSGMLLGALACRFQLVGRLLYPLVTVIKATPVASFVILALVWVSSRSLATLISFLMAFPIVYQNFLQGLHETDPKLLEMAKVFGIGKAKQAIWIYLPSTLPYLVSAISLSIGLCWKAGIAAEVIGIPEHSIGGALYNAKIFLNTSEMFAWTAAIILISVLFERMVLCAVQRLRVKLERA